MNEPVRIVDPVARFPGDLCQFVSHHEPCAGPMILDLRSQPPIAWVAKFNERAPVTLLVHRRGDRVAVLHNGCFLELDLNELRPYRLEREYRRVELIKVVPT